MFLYRGSLLNILKTLKEKYSLIRINYEFSNYSRRISLFTSSLASKVDQFIRLDDTMEYVRFNVHMRLLMVQKHTYDFEVVH